MQYILESNGSTGLERQRKPSRDMYNEKVRPKSFIKHIYQLIHRHPSHIPHITFVELAGLQVVAWDQPYATIAIVHLGLPPTIVLVAQNG